jgi:hypothetical protein
MGAVLIAVSIIYLDKTTPFPGWWALLPTIGASLMIFSSPSSLLNRTILANRLLVWIGLISFPLYLWHWPLLSFARIIETQTPAPFIRLFALLASVVLAALTYYFVEKPIRFGRHIKTPILLGVMLVIGLLGYADYQNKGFVTRFHKTPLLIRDGEYKCTHDQQTTGKPCEFGNLDAHQIILIYGDSMSGQLTNALNEKFGHQYKLVYFGHGGCFIGDGDGSPICNAFREELSKFRDQDVYAVIRSQRWARYGATTEDTTKALILDAVKVSNLHPKKIIIVGSTQDVNTECEFANYYIPFRKRDCGFNVASSELNKLFITTSKKISLPSNIFFLYPSEKVCINDRCQVISNSISNYSDSAHISTDGALLAMPDIAKILNQ